MTGTTPKGYPYPTGSDRVQDGDNAIQALAQAVNDRAIQHRGHGGNLDAGGTAQPSLPATLFIITGRVTVNFVSSVGTPIVFPGGGFPNGVLGISMTTASSPPGVPLVNGISKTQVVPGATGSVNLNSVDVFYIAIGY